MRSYSYDAPSDRMVPFNVSGHFFTIPESQILRYPYSKLADLAASSLHDDVAAIEVPVEVSSSLPLIFPSPANRRQSFSLLVHYLDTKSLPPPLSHPPTLHQTFRTLGIPFPASSTPVNHHEASTGSAGSLREWAQKSNLRSTRDEYTPDLRSSLARMERGMLTTLDSVNADENDGLPAYDHSERHPQAPIVADGKHVNLFDACLGAVTGKKPLVVVLTSGLKPIELQPWEAAPDEEVLSYPDIPVEQKKIIRIGAESSPAEVKELREQLRDVLGIPPPPPLFFFLRTPIPPALNLEVCAEIVTLCRERICTRCPRRRGSDH